MSTVSELAQAAAALSLEEQKLLIERLKSNLKAHVEPGPQRPRIPGLGAGQSWMADDFNDPLPDDFWLSEDAYTGQDPNDEAYLKKLRETRGC